MAMAVRYNGKEPDKRKGASQEEYALPFEGAWTVVNGGVDKETSHSWGVLTQRYAYDFVVLDDEGRNCPPDADPADPASYYCYGLPVLAPWRKWGRRARMRRSCLMRRCTSAAVTFAATTFSSTTGTTSSRAYAI